MALTIWHSEIATVRSIEQVGDNEYLYRMDYKASYDLDDVISKDIDSNPELLQYATLYQKRKSICGEADANR